MTGREILNALKDLPEETLSLPAVAMDGASGVSYEVTTYGSEKTASEHNEAGTLCDMPGEKYLAFYLN